MPGIFYFGISADISTFIILRKPARTPACGPLGAMLMDTSNISLDKIKWLKTIGLYQLFGAFLGLIMTFPLFGIINSIINSPYNILVVIIYVFSMYCGWTLYRFKDNSIKLTYINQFIQIFSVAVSTSYFNYSAGLAIDIEFDMTNQFNLGFDIKTPSSDFILNGGKDQLYFAINVIPIYIILQIEKIIGQKTKADKIKHST